MQVGTLDEIQVEDASDEATLDAALRLRAAAYGPDAQAADGVAETVLEDDDRTGVILVARAGAAVVGTLRMNWVDAGVSPELGAALQLDRFLEYTTAAHVVVCSRFAVSAEQRGGLLAGRMIVAAAHRAAARQFEVALCDCQPHLLELYQRAGFRLYAPVFEHAQGGVVIPLALLCDDLEHLRAIRSPLTSVLARTEAPRASIDGLLEIVRGSPATGIEREWRDFGLLYGRSLDRARLFAGLEEEERACLLKRGTVLALAPGQRLIVEAQPTRTIYIVLDGLLEVVRDGRVVGFAGAGDVVGELATLLELPRTGMVTACEPAKVLAISDRVLDTMLGSDPTLAAKLGLNLAREVARKLVTRVPGAQI